MKLNERYTTFSDTSQAPHDDHTWLQQLGTYHVDWLRSRLRISFTYFLKYFFDNLGWFDVIFLAVSAQQGTNLSKIKPTVLVIKPVYLIIPYNHMHTHAYKNIISYFCHWNQNRGPRTNFTVSYPVGMQFSPNKSTPSISQL